MTEKESIRLSVFLKEFNVGVDTVREFLESKYPDIANIKLTTKLEPHVLEVLRKEFGNDKDDKDKAAKKNINTTMITDPTSNTKKEPVSPFTKDVSSSTKNAVTPPPVEKIATTKTHIVAPAVVGKVEIESAPAIKHSTTVKNTEAPQSIDSEAVPVVSNPIDMQPSLTDVPEVKPPVASKEAPVVDKVNLRDKYKNHYTSTTVTGTIQLVDEFGNKLGDRRERKKIVLPKAKAEPPIFDEKQHLKGGGTNRYPANRNSEGGNRGDHKTGHQGYQKVEINNKEIQEKIKETQAKLSSDSNSTIKSKARYRREKREEIAAEKENRSQQDDKKISVAEFVTASELASLLNVNYTEIISKCFSLGTIVSINQRLDAEVIELVAHEFGYTVEFIEVKDIMDIADDETDLPENMLSRPPIVTIMGHVDHGKTSLLDNIRSTNVVAGEAGGITQHIGAYEVMLPNGREITFLDTPGHEAFTAMRARGAKATDIAVIVIAADDAVMPQTKEAINHALAASVPMIFAINKIDKPGANKQKIFEQLSQLNILVEEWGGKYQTQEISAKSGINVNLLLDKIIAEADLLELKANPHRNSRGIIIDASLDKGRGFVATLLVQNGTLKKGDIIVSGQFYGRVKAMFNERNIAKDAAVPSSPVLILGLNGAPQAGESFKVYNSESEAKAVSNRRAQLIREQGFRTKKHITLDEIGRRLALGTFKELCILIKGDVDGSVEALGDSLQKLSTNEIVIKIVHKGVGEISESDVLLATASDSIIIGFNVRPSHKAQKLAREEGVEVKLYSIIYTAIDEIKSAMEGMLDAKIEEHEVANVLIKDVFKFDKLTVAGCLVEQGKIKRDHKIRIFRDGILLHPRQEGAFAELSSLKRFKDDAKEVSSSMECGLTIKNFTDLKPNDSIVAYEQQEIKRTL
ncbi:MAG: translation initiation factor IF-2 [Phycisphaerales bacterium]|nr:translation initiation factor IF-2 [Phycisphaerales bacterium]